MTTTFTVQDLLATLNLIFRSGTAFTGTLDHAISANRVWTLPDATDTLVGLATVDTLTNKTIRVPDGTVGAPSYSFASGTTSGLYWSGGVLFAIGGVRLASLTSAGLFIDKGALFLRDLTGASTGTAMIPETNHVVAQRMTTNAQTYRVYGTWTDASNYERLSLTHTTGTGPVIAAQTLGTGADDLSIRLTPAGTGAVLSAFKIASDGATAGIGYATGAGGTQTQATSKATTVVLDKASGQITMHNATLNAGTSVGFTLTNSAIATTDVVVVSIDAGATADSYLVGVDAVGAGSCRIHLRNTSAGNLGEAVVLNFAVIKAVAA